MIMITIVVMALTRANSVTPNTRHAPLKNSPVKTSSVSVINIVAMVKMIVVITRMKLAVRRIILPVPRDNMLVPMVNVLICLWFVIRSQTVRMILMSRPTVMWMNAPRWKSISVAISVWIHQPAIIVIVIKVISKYSLYYECILI